MIIYPDRTDEGFETPFSQFMRARERFFKYCQFPKEDKGFIRECKENPIFAIQACMTIQNPKDFIEKGVRRIGFRLYKYQAKFIRHMNECYLKGEDAIVKKSRETGFSWLVASYGVWRWLFFKDENIVYLTLKKDALYKRNNPGTLFGKVEYLIQDLNGRLCRFKDKDRTGAQIKNTINGSIIRGVGGKSSVRSDRCSLLLLDEVAYWENAESITGDLTSVASCNIYGSTLNQPGDFFDQKCNQLKDYLFEFNWRDDPRKAAPGWKEGQIRKIGIDHFNVEYDMKYNEATRCPLVRYDWFKSAMDFKMDRPSYYKPKPVAGFDIAEGGGNYCALVIRNEGEIIFISKWREDDMKESVRNVIAFCMEYGCESVNYDATAQGKAVRYAIDAIESEYTQIPYFNAISMTMGVPERFYGGRAAKDQFANGRIYWSYVFRDGILATYNYVKYSDKQQENIDTTRMIWFSNSLNERLLGELLNEANGVEVLTSSNGKLILESKKQMAQRGMKSPDLLDACVLSFIGYDLAGVYG